MVDIVAANVTSVNRLKAVLPAFADELKLSPGKPTVLVVGTITTATNTDYDTTTEIPLDNLFTSGNASDTGLDESSCRAVFSGQYIATTNHFETYFDWPNKKLRILKMDVTAAEANQKFVEIADGTAIGTGTCDFAVIGKAR